MENTPDVIDEVTYPPIDESETELCRALWVSVCVQAVVDARSETNDPKLKPQKAIAMEWLRAEEGEESDLAEVCSLAGLDFEKTQTRLLELATDDDRFLDFRCLKKALMSNRGIESRSSYFKRLRRQERYRKEKINPSKNPDSQANHRFLSHGALDDQYHNCPRRAALRCEAL